MVMYPYVLVGYDGMVESDRALQWAAEEARLRRLELVVCHCWRWPYPISHVDHDIERTVQRMGEHLLDHGADRAAHLAPTVKVRKRLMDGPAYAALMHESSEAELIVVGSHEQDELAVGSTALRLPVRSRRPVVVVRQAASSYDHVVVGVDGSPGADAALAFAFEEAALRGWTLEAVYGCWEPGAVAESELALFADRDALTRSCGARLERAVAPWREKYPQVEARTSLIMEGPRTALLNAAAAASLVVVGDRGTGNVDPLLLGATSSALLHHAPCTVAVVHDPQR
ncbi:universal stress protein [Actinomadura rudentiformis]|uniref:Universal stress protein n=1 Tax=Actinomadura rudentiformis TaxID=359158 RepID=A0A6H9YXR8_9ACTN|nr:universal stress protein [Actinomadura rudentiformis]KAB2352244.1 universal stress protein [Actinomadura rudentiformis]